MSRISIVTPWHGHPELLRNYERAVAGAEVIIVDNASDPETAAALVAMCERLGNGSKVIRNETNRMFAPANNQGLEAATGDIVMFLNDDVIGKPDWMRMVERDVRPGVLVGPNARLFETVVEVMQTPGLRELLAAGLSFPYVEGWCVAGRREVWDKLGGWDADAFPLPYVEDVDLSWRARCAGITLMHSHWRIRHIGNVTTRTIPNVLEKIQANALTFVERVKRWHDLRSSVIVPIPGLGRAA